MEQIMKVVITNELMTEIIRKLQKLDEFEFVGKIVTEIKELNPHM